MSPSEAFSQAGNGIVLRGTVLEYESNEPMIGVHVFVSGTTIGTATDRDGRFEFRYDNPPLEFDLVASIIGFAVEVSSFETVALIGTEIEFVLSPRVYEMGGVVITSTNEAWKENLERFKRLIFSTTENGRKSELLNPEVLDFTVDPVTDVLTAMANEPLRVENDALGYRITIHNPHLRGTEAGLIWGGEMQFEGLTPRNDRQERKWASARKTAYGGSTKHFLTAVASDTIYESGFAVYTVPSPGTIVKQRKYRAEISLNPPTEEGEPDPSVLRYFSFPEVLLVRYDRERESNRYADHMVLLGMRGAITPSNMRISRAQDYQMSWLVLHSETAMIDHRGIEYGDVAMERFGYWSWERLGEMLPSDFEMDE